MAYQFTKAEIQTLTAARDLCPVGPTEKTPTVGDNRGQATFII